LDEEKTRRPYNSARRQSQARETRRQILEAARRLFVGAGYGATSIDAIAAEAGVAPETIYATYRNKRAILSALLDVSIVGDDAPVALRDRPMVRDALQAGDQREQLRLMAHIVRDVDERAGPIYAIIRGVAGADPSIAEMYQRIQDARYEGVRAALQALAHKGPLRDGLELHVAVDVAWTISSPEVHYLLTADRGWSADRYETWLAETLITMLLPPTAQHG
jgi:AcrR family transcriptional regulator